MKLLSFLTVAPSSKAPPIPRSLAAYMRGSWEVEGSLSRAKVAILVGVDSTAGIGLTGRAEFFTLAIYRSHRARRGARGRKPGVLGRTIRENRGQQHATMKKVASSRR